MFGVKHPGLFERGKPDDPRKARFAPLRGGLRPGLTRIVRLAVVFCGRDGKTALSTELEDGSGIGRVGIYVVGVEWAICADDGVCQDKQFAGDGDQHKLVGFAGGFQTLRELGQARIMIMSAGGEGGEVERAAHGAVADAADSV